MVHEGDVLIVQAFTTNQPFLRGDRVQRGQAQISWQAFDTRQPVVIDDYSAWVARRAIYNPLALAATADFPIVVGDAALGVLAMGRPAGSQPFTATEVQQGLLFSQLIGMVISHAQLYDLALREIAERKEVEQSLREQTELLNARNAELDAFAHTVAHDLKTPLTGLIGQSELLKLGVLRGKIVDVPTELDTLIAIGRKMSQIITEMLLLASVRKQADVPSTQLEMAPIVQEVQTRLAHQITATEATLIQPDTWPTAIGYAPWIEEVWSNYLSNALKYGGQPPQITMGADLVPGFVRFWVRDNGPGLSAEQRSRLFTTFTRLDTARATGHGLGLSIVQRIIAKLGGEVGVESGPAQGTCFFFTLPQ